MCQACSSNFIEKPPTPPESGGRSITKNTEDPVQGPCILPCTKKNRTVKTRQKAGQLNFLLPGRGTRRDECGHVKSIVYCDKHKTLHDQNIVTRWSCKRLQCPVCRDRAIYRVAKRITEKVEQAEKLYTKEGAKLGPIRHIVLSPPGDDGYGTVDDYRTARKKATYRLRESGARGAVVVYHHWRFNKFDDDGNLKKPDLPYGAPYVSPHYHCLAYGWLIKSDEFYDSTGWIYKNKGKRKSLFDTIEYLMSHCGILPSHHVDAYTYVGVLSSRYIKKAGKPIKEETPMLCDHLDCDCQMNHHTEDGYVLEPAFFVHTYQRYELIKHLVVQADIIKFKKPPDTKGEIL